LAREFFPACAEPVFRLSPAEVFCDSGGARVAGVALLECAADSRGEKRWRVRPIDELNRELTAEYGLPLDLGGKVAGLTVVAKALDRGEIAKAQIAMLLMRFPDPPPLDKGARPSDDLGKLANALAESGLLKDDDFESEHPRTGTPPNPGWFASKPKRTMPARAPTADPRRAWPSRDVNERIREWLVEATKALTASGTADPLPTFVPFWKMRMRTSAGGPPVNFCHRPRPLSGRAFFALRPSFGGPRGKPMPASLSV
jgi:hypothetical protein